MTIPPRRINTGGPPSRRNTKMDRVLIITSDKAAELAKRWQTTKQEVYRYLVDRAIEENVKPAAPVEARQKEER